MEVNLWRDLPPMEQTEMNKAEMDAINQVSPIPPREITGNGQSAALLPVRRDTQLPIGLTPVDLLRIAVSQNADIDKLTKLMDLQERWEKNEAEKAFDAAMQRFKANAPNISKNHAVKFGNTAYKHATLDHACDEIIPALSAVGITHKWRMTQDKDLITVICVLKGFGHSEETQLQGVPDNSGSKNSIQAVASTVTYLQRYTLLSACGLAAKNDDDGQTSGKPVVEASELEKNIGEMSRAKDFAVLKFLYTVAYQKAQDLNDRNAMSRYIQVRDARKKELENATR
jgi:hypothetical protein